MDLPPPAPGTDTPPRPVQSRASVNACTTSTRQLFPASCFSATLSCRSRSLRSCLQSSFASWVTLTLSHFPLNLAPIFPPVGSVFSPVGGILGHLQHCFWL